jgi:adenylate cyclase
MSEKKPDYFSFLLGLEPRRLGLGTTLLTGPISKEAGPSLFGSIASLGFLDNLDSLTNSGRVAPEDGDLGIGKGRFLENATILFLDICGFSARPSETREEQERILRTLNLFLPEMIRILEEYGGTIEKNTGDGLLVWFVDGFSERTGNGSERALKAAIEMQQRNQQFVNPILRSRGIEEITFRVTMDCGPVTIANLGSAKRHHSNTAIGTKANIACKLLRLAGPGDIVVGDVARGSLPVLVQSRLRQIMADTGWHYRLSGAKYSAWVYR